MTTLSRNTPAGLPLIPDAEELQFLAQATEALIGHRHLDALGVAALRALTPTHADAAMLDLRTDDGSGLRLHSQTTEPGADERARAFLGALLPPVSNERSPLVAVIEQGKTLARGEIGDGPSEFATYSLLCLPLSAGDGPKGALTLLTVGRHDRYGRRELALLREYGARLERALGATWSLERTRSELRALQAHRAVIEDAGRTVERLVIELRDEVAGLKAENAALRVQADAERIGAAAYATRMAEGAGRLPPSILNALRSGPATQEKAVSE